MNSWDFTGRLGADPSLREVGDNLVVSMRVAVSTTAKQHAPAWVGVSVWQTAGRNGPANWVMERCRKGSRIGVSNAELRIREWETREGEKRQSVEAAGFSLRVHFLDPREGNPHKPGPTRPSAQAPNPSAVEKDDDIPF